MGGGRDGRATLRAVFAVMRDGSLSAGARVTWALYRSWDSGDGAWPGDDTMAGVLGVSVRQVQRYRRELMSRKPPLLERRLRGPKPVAYRALPPGEREDTGVASREDAGVHSTSRADVRDDIRDDTGVVQSTGSTGSTDTNAEVEEDVKPVFDLCRTLRAERLGKTSGPPLQLTAKRASKIRARLREGFSRADLEDAARGFYADTWEKRDRYLDPVYAFKDDDTVRRFMDQHRDGRPPDSRESVRQTRVALRAMYRERPDG